MISFCMQPNISINIPIQFTSFMPIYIYKYVLTLEKYISISISENKDRNNCTQQEICVAALIFYLDRMFRAYRACNFSFVLQVIFV